MSASTTVGGDRPGPTRTHGADRAGSGRAAWAGGWQPLAGPALLERLRVTGRARPLADPSMVADLRAHLGLDLGIGPGGPDGPVVVTAGRLTRALACSTHADLDGTDEAAPSLALACGALVDVLFRQLVATGRSEDAFEDALDALSVDDRQLPLVAWIDALTPAERAGLRAEVDRQAEGLRKRWPVLDPTWLPRTKECLRVPAFGGGFELVARVDLAIGRPAVDEASVALVDVTSGLPRSVHVADRHFAALVETLRSGVPPFAVATYYTRTGELDVDPVTVDVLVSAARRCRAGLGALVGDAAPWRADDPMSWCAACADTPLAAAAPPAPALPPVAMAEVRTGGGGARAGGAILLPEERAA